MTITNETIYGASSVLIAAIAAVSDLRTRRIPNALTGPAILFGLGLHLVLGGAASLGYAALGGITSGAIFLVFYLAGGMGAGDVKLMTAIGCILGLGNIRPAILAIVIAGGICAIAMATYKGALRVTFNNVGTLIAHHRSSGLTPHTDLNVTNARTIRLPYGLPIAAGCIIAFILAATKQAAQ